MSISCCQVKPHRRQQATAAARNIEILRNDTSVQAVRETTLGITGANFWKAENVDYLTAYNPSSVVVKDVNNQLEVAVSDPTHSQQKVTIELSKSGLSILDQDSTVTVLQLFPTIIFEVDVDETPGKTHTVTFSYDPDSPTLAPPTVHAIEPEADAYVRDGSYMDTNYGSAAALDIKKSTEYDGYNRQAYLKFDLSSIIGEITYAKLYVYGEISNTGVGTDQDCKVYGVDDDNWTENGITWNNKPAAGSHLATANITDPSEWREIDITSYVQTQYAGDKKVSLILLEDITGLNVNANSKENTVNKPYLKVIAHPGKLINAEADAYLRDGSNRCHSEVLREITIT